MNFDNIIGNFKSKPRLPNITHFESGTWKPFTEREAQSLAAFLPQKVTDVFRPSATDGFWRALYRALSRPRCDTAVVVGHIARIVDEERDYSSISKASHEFLNQLGDNLRRIDNLARTRVIDTEEADDIASYVGLVDGKTLHALLWMEHGQLPNVPEIFRHKSWIQKLLPG